MNKDQFPARFALDRTCAGFSFLGFSWEDRSSMLMLALLLLAAVIVLTLWLRRRRRKSDLPSLSTGFTEMAPGRDADAGITQIEGLSEGGSSIPSAGPSPGLHGKIEVLVGSQPISSYLITDNPLPIGRDPAQSLVIIQEPIVSKLHCQIFVRNGNVFIKDLNSTNGVYVNEEKVSERQLQDNDVVFLGKKGTVRIVYHC